METPQLARCSRLLDELRDDCEKLGERTGFAIAARMHAKVVEIQSILLGEPPTQPGHN